MNLSLVAARLKLIVMFIEAMRKCWYIVALIFLMSCSGHYDAEKFDTQSIFLTSTDLLMKYHGNAGTLHMELWPKLLVDIGAKTVIVREGGIYIKLNEDFVQERGLYVPRKFVKIKESPGSDPSYKELSNGVYSYVIKG